MTRDEILSELKRLEPWFHRIDLGNGLFTKTESVMKEPVEHPHDLWQTVQKLVPTDLTGKSVLDVGCNAGFFSFELKRRGARRVLGVDGQRQHVRQGLFVRKVLGLDVEFRRMNVYELNPREPGQFDITLALGLIYHLKHPILALENLYQVTKELLIIETAIMPPENTPVPLPYDFGSGEKTLHPLAYVENPAQAKEQVFNWFLPSVSALTALLRNTGFDEVEVIDTKNHRAVVTCRKTKASMSEELKLSHFVARLNTVNAPEVCSAGSTHQFQLRVENIGLKSWHAGNGTEPGTVNVGAHLLRADEDEVDWDYGRGRLSRDIAPGETAEVDVTLTAPDTPGDYIVEFDMVAEHVTWFEDHGSGTLRHRIRVV